jgi:heptosyltransferase-3
MSYGNYPNCSGVKKILVIKLRQLGDTLLTTPVFATLKNRFPNAEIHAYVYRESCPLLEDNPSIDQCIGYDRNWKKSSLPFRLWKEYQILKEICSAGYDLVVNLTEGDRGAIAAYVANAKIRVGFEPKSKLQKGLYTHVVKHCPTPRHTVEKNLDALRKIGIFPKMEERELFLKASQKSPIQGPYVLIHPTSRWKFKCWPVEKMRTLAQELLLRGKKVVFTCGSDVAELAMVREITEGLDVINLGGQISLKELAALIAHSEILICVDSLVFHMANALKKPVVALFGPTSDISWGAWRNPHAKIVKQEFSCRPCYQDGCGGSKYSDCLATLQVSNVLYEIDQSLKSSPKYIRLASESLTNSSGVPDKSTFPS